VIFALLLGLGATTTTADPIAAIRADDWSDAQRAAASYADPVANKLVTYYRLLTPGAATADDVVSMFFARHADALA